MGLPLEEITEHSIEKELRVLDNVVLTLIQLLHQWQLDLLQAVEVVHAGAVVRHSGYVSQGQEGLPAKVIGRQDVVVHHREADHGTFGETLLQGHGELKAFIEYGIQSPLMGG